jgi:hypothetical protein
MDLFGIYRAAGNAQGFSQRVQIGSLLKTPNGTKLRAFCIEAVAPRRALIWDRVFGVAPRRALIWARAFGVAPRRALFASPRGPKIRCDYSNTKTGSTMSRKYFIKTFLFL